MQLPEEMLARLDGVAAERSISRPAALRELLALGYRVYERRKEIGYPVEALVIDLTAREGGGAAA